MDYRAVENKIGLPYTIVALIPALLAISLFYQKYEISVIFCIAWSLIILYLKPTFKNLNKIPDYKKTLVIWTAISILSSLVVVTLLDKPSINLIGIYIIILVTLSLYLTLISRGAKLLFAYEKRNKRFVHYYGNRPKGFIRRAYLRFGDFIDNALHFVFIGLIFTAAVALLSTEYVKNTNKMILLATYTDNLTNSLSLLAKADGDLECELYRRATHYQQELLGHNIEDYSNFVSEDAYCTVETGINDSLEMFDSYPIEELEVKCNTK